jgi:phosphoribosylformylglycinamidine (FGAM) synthase-like enzyme
MSVPKTEVEETCLKLRGGKRPNAFYLAAMLEAQQATIERLEQEIEVLRRVTRAADYTYVKGKDSFYDEARNALMRFDINAEQKVLTVSEILKKKR